MAKIDFNTAIDENNGYVNNNSNSNGGGTEVGFFTLRNDGDSAVVRFMYDSTDDFEILAVHNVTVGGKYRKVNCIRTPHDPLDACPLCNSGSPISLRFFIKLIQYVTDPATGVVTPKAMIWERATNYAKTLKTYLDNYGPLSDVICKVVRHGKAGDMSTTYEIVPNLSKAVYRDDVYVKDTNIFGDFAADGTFVMNKTAPEMSEFLATGSFPQKPTVSNNEVTPRTYDQQPPVTVPPMNGQPAYNMPQNAAPVYNGPQQASMSHPVDSGAPDYNQPQQSTVNPAPAFMTNPAAQQAPQFNAAPEARPTMPWENPNTANNMGRPVRRY